MANSVQTVRLPQTLRRPLRVPRFLVAVLRFCRRKPLGAIGAVLVVGLIVMAVFADRIAPYSYDESVPGSRMKPPSVRFMGTDNIGRDMWSRAVRHARRLSTAGRRQDSKPWAHPAHH